MEHGRWSPIKLNISSIRAVGFLSPNDRKFNTLAARSLSDKLKVSSRLRLRAAYFCSSDAGIKGKQLFVLSPDIEQLLRKYLVSSAITFRRANCAHRDVTVASQRRCIKSCLLDMSDVFWERDVLHVLLRSCFTEYFPYSFN